MKIEKFILILTLILWIFVRFYLRQIVQNFKVFDFWFTDSYPSFALVYGYCIFKYLQNKKENIKFIVLGVTLGGILYEVIGQKVLDFGTYSNSDVTYTILGGVASFYSLNYFSKKTQTIAFTQSNLL